MTKHWPNVITCVFVCGEVRALIIGVYIPPSEVNLSTIKILDSLSNLIDEKTVILGDLNINYPNPKDERSDEIVDALSTYNLFDLSTRFSPKKQKPHNWTWRVHWEGKQVKSICDYILSEQKLK